MTVALPDGWLLDVEAEALTNLATGRNVLELGSYKGRSTVAMSRTARYLLSVDHHRGDPDAGSEDTLAEFYENVKQLENVDFVVGDMAVVLQFLRDNYFDLVFVDGAHDYESVRRDAMAAWRLCHKTGVIAFHDWQFESVRAGASIHYDEPSELIGTIAVFR